MGQLLEQPFTANDGKWNNATGRSTANTGKPTLRAIEFLSLSFIGVGTPGPRRAISSAGATQKVKGLAEI